MSFQLQCAYRYPTDEICNVKECYHFIITSHGFVDPTDALLAEDRGPLTFAEFRREHQAQAEYFPDNETWALNDWMVALAGEVGEACNIAKKIRRGDYTLDQVREKMADEFADVFSYLDHAAAFCGIDLEAAIRRKFNIVSERRGAPQRL